MTKTNYIVQTAHGLNPNPGNTQFQPIHATYFNIVSNQGWPIGGLLILLDSTNQPVRAELHLYEDVGEQAHETAIRHAIQLLRKRFAQEPEGSISELDLRVMGIYEQRETIQVQLPVGRIQDTTPSRSLPLSLPTTAMATALLLFLVSGIWAALVFFRSSDIGNSLDATAGADSIPETPIDNSPATVSTTASQENNSVSNVEADPIDPAFPQTNNLPVSRLANAALEVGRRVRIRPSFTLTLRSQPGASAGEEKGYMQDQQEATIIGGPYWTRGDSDTIVWWYVRLDSGLEAWAAANTSQFMLLEPVTSN
ncbi:hypothetical protein KFU94_22030 [Chloroflexi bacterium TSY]|nr:hypothetical protein [Chloroflexi bacterium TSY]